MKILHTSDWHLGQVLYEYDRTEEQRDFLEQLVSIAEQEHPDAMVLCGDVFDKVSPSTEARQLYVKALLKLHDHCPNMQIVVTAGNHDGKSALEVEALLWDRLQVRVVGQVFRHENGEINIERHIVEVFNDASKRIGYIIAVPHIYENYYPQTDDSQTKEERQKAFFQLLLDAVAARNTDNLPVVLTAHLSLAGSNFAGHQFADSIGTIEVVDQSQLGTGYDYLALGHIHNAKTFTGSGPVARYCGTPLPVAFDEQGKHSVSIVNLMPGTEVSIREVPVHNIRPLLTIPPKPIPFEEALLELSQLPDNTEAYIRLNVLQNGPLPPNHIERILQVLEVKRARYCTVKTSKPSQNQLTDAPWAAGMVNADNMPTPRELASYFYDKKYGVPLDDELLNMLDEAIKSATNTLQEPENKML